MLPGVVYHVEVSLDGSIDWIAPDVGRYYRLASVFAEDCALTGAAAVDTTAAAPGPFSSQAARSSAEPTEATTS